MTADQILQNHEDANEMHFHQVDREFIIQAMEEYATSSQTENGCKGSDETKIEKIPINLTSTQLIELAEIGTEFIYEGANGDTRLSSGGIIKIIQKYNEMTSSQTEISDEEIEKEAENTYVKYNAYAIEGFIDDATWYREQLKNKQ